jgi:arylsulfatase A-like enzyme
LQQVPDGDKTFEELNYVSQSGTMKMVRMGDWKLIYDMMGYDQLYNLARDDPFELTNLFNEPSVSTEQAQLLAELLMWTVRTQDNLPTAACKTKWPSGHNLVQPLSPRQNS